LSSNYPKDGTALPDGVDTTMCRYLPLEEVRR